MSAEGETRSLHLLDTIWEPRWWTYLFPVAQCGRVRVDSIEPSAVDGLPHRAVCVTDDDRRVVIDLNRRKDGLVWFKRVGSL